MILKPKLKIIEVVAILILPVVVMLSLIYFDPFNLIKKNQIKDDPTTAFISDSTEKINNNSFSKDGASKLSDIIKNNLQTGENSNIADPLNKGLPKSTDVTDAATTNDTQDKTNQVDNKNDNKVFGIELSKIREIQNTKKIYTNSDLSVYSIVSTTNASDNIRSLKENPLIQISDPMFGRFYDETDYLLLSYNNKVYYPGKSIQSVYAFKKGDQEYWVSLAIGRGGAIEIILSKPLMIEPIYIKDLQNNFVLSLNETDKQGVFVAKTVNGNGLKTNEINYKLDFNILIDNPQSPTIIIND